MRRFLILLVIVARFGTGYERRKNYKHTPYGSHIASTGSYTQNKGIEYFLTVNLEVLVSNFIPIKIKMTPQYQSHLFIKKYRLWHRKLTKMAFLSKNLDQFFAFLCFLATKFETNQL